MMAGQSMRNAVSMQDIYKAYLITGIVCNADAIETKEFIDGLSNRILHQLSTVFEVEGDEDQAMIERIIKGQTLHALYGVDPHIDQMATDFQVGKWRIHLVDVGDKWGLDDRLTCDRKDLGRSGLPLVEFYDASQDPAKFPGGQFVSRYYMETLIGLENPKDSLTYTATTGSRLDLYGSCASWKLTNEETMLVGTLLTDLAETKYQHRLNMEEPSRSTSLKETCEQAKQSSAALNNRSNNQPNKVQEAR